MQVSKVIQPLPRWSLFEDSANLLATAVAAPPVTVRFLRRAIIFRHRRGGDGGCEFDTPYSRTDAFEEMTPMTTLSTMP